MNSNVFFKAFSCFIEFSFGQIETQIHTKVQFNLSIGEPNCFF
jgi:hypothetical protein